MAMDDEGEKDEVADVEGDEYLAIFLGHTLTPPLVEATIMVMKQKKYTSSVYAVCVYLNILPGRFSPT